VAGEPSDLPVLLFGGCRGHPGEWFLPRPGAEGPGTASPGSSWGSTGSAGMAAGAKRWLPGLPARAVDEMPRSSSTLDLAELPQRAEPGLGDPPQEAARPGAPGF